MQPIWYDLIINSNRDYIYACDVKIAYFINKYIDNWEIKYVKMSDDYVVPDFLTQIDFISHSNDIPENLLYRHYLLSKFNYKYHIGLDCYISEYNILPVENLTIDKKCINNDYKMRFYYGVSRCVVEVTDVVFEKCFVDKNIVINMAYNTLFNDPFPNIFKYLFVEYYFNCQSEGGRVNKIVSQVIENGSITIQF